MLYNVFMDTIPNAPHQKLADGLNVLVLQEHMTKAEAERIYNHYVEYHPNEDYLDEAVLFSIRKRYGLEPVSFDIVTQQEEWEKKRDTEASIDCAGSYRRVVGGQ